MISAVRLSPLCRASALRRCAASGANRGEPTGTGLWFGTLEVDIIATRRLRLEPVGPEHAEATAALMSPVVADMLFSWPSPMSVDEARERIAAAQAAARSSTERHWAIMRLGGGLVGWISLLPAGPDRAAIGLWIGYCYWNHGFATEAINGVVAHARSHWPHLAIIANVRPRNGRSLKLMHKLGACPAGRTVITNRSGAAIEHLCFELPFEEPSLRVANG